MFNDQEQMQTTTLETQTLSEQILSISHPLQTDADLDVGELGDRRPDGMDTQV